VVLITSAKTTRRGLEFAPWFERERLIARHTRGPIRGSATMTDLTMAKAILAQLGGERLVMMTGATGFIGSADSLTFKLGSNPKHVTHVRVTLTPDGLYDMTFFRTGKGPQSYDGVHREMLQEVFGANTGLYMTLQSSAKSRQQWSDRPKRIGGDPR
jgi:hypothetical protein